MICPHTFVKYNGQKLKPYKMEMIRVAKEIHVNPDIKICMACGMLKINEQLTLNKKYL